MTTHNFEHEWSAASPYCAAMVMRNGGGDTCGQPREHRVHADSAAPPVDVSSTACNAETAPEPFQNPASRSEDASGAAVQQVEEVSTPSGACMHRPAHRRYHCAICRTWVETEAGEQRG